MEERPPSFLHRLLAAFCYWIGLLWIPIFLWIAPRAVELGFWDEFEGNPIAALLGTVVILPPLAIAISIGCQILYWLCVRHLHPQINSCGRATANLGLVAALPFLIGGAVLPVIGGYIWLMGLLLIPIYTLMIFWGGFLALLEGDTLNLPMRMRVFR
jgi:hypothetical protein